MKKTLLICTHYPLPETIGTNMRTMNFVRFFKNHGIVDIAYSRIMPEAQTGNPIFSHEYFLEQEVGQSFQDRLMRWINIKKRPYPICKYTDHSEKRLLSIVESNDYDYIFARYIYNTSSLFKLPQKYRIRAVIDFDDILSDSLYESKIVSVNGYLRRLRCRLNQKYLINYEKKCLKFGASLFCSEKDRDRFVENCVKNNTFVVPNIYVNKSFDDYNFGDGFENENNLLFVGTLNYEPNIKGLRWFIESIFPHFKQKFPDSKLTIIGRCSNKEIEDIFKRNSDIELYTNVPDVKEYYKQCKAVVVPLLSGGGTRIKILEAALANRPVLSTPIGAEGLDLVDDTDLLLFKDARDFSTQYKKLLDRNKYNSLIQCAKKQVLTKYAAQRFNDDMEKVLNVLEHKKLKY